ncbi:long-chain-fatty-acid--CoA ligase [Clostridium beijerinckii]|nr:long-chain-fatty-acid--CoA ligase [Clostridium beijerinckii]OOM70911.1 long-chain-fatty-acid--CoA ligase [Clostridium beijerinckii]CUU50890.1 conserved protein of unknown function [Clostridium beijerinckii]
MVEKYLFNYITKWKDEYPESIAIRYLDKNISYKSLYYYIINTQNMIRKLGINENDSVIYIGKKNEKLIIVQLALFNMKIPVMVAKNNIQKSNLENFKQLCNNTYIIFDENIQIFEDDSLIFCEKSDELGVLLISENNYLYIGELFLKENHLEYIPDEVNSNDKVYLNTTSGTTNISKIVSMEEYKIIENAKSINEIFPMDSSDCFMCLLPEYMHPHEIYCRPLIAGASIALLESKHMYKIAHYIKKYNVTQIFGIPSQFLAFLNFNIEKSDFKTIKYIFSGGEKTTNYLRRAFWDKYEKTFVTFWGSTETGGSTIYNNRLDLENYDDVIGRALPGYKIKLSENNELCIKGKACFDGYLDSNISSNIDLEGYYNTKDIVAIDNDGLYRFVGREDSIIKINGNKVSINNINEYLSKCIHIKQFFTCITENNKHIKILFIYITPVSELEEEHIREYINLYFSSEIKYRVVFLDNMPKTDFQKTNIHLLKELAKDEVNNDGK